ncbi:uncharacterized protein LOC114530939 [Dendronephthya gigantea]|uniref:uncharacterized protein LOC114530939 n=1 Tax=Dendronephthya gigantea TaxID=151771 RepID=UPI00106B8E21|nr:uncharacterized protein LOC114530939 [Dendronephthya gigantea]
MSSSSSDAESNSYQSDDSDWNYIPGPYIIKKQSEAAANIDDQITDETSELGPYANEPAADEEWLANYREKKQTYDERLKEFQRRLDGIEELDKWCKCGNCRIELLHNAKECQCCVEIEECEEALNSELVMQELERENPPSCIVDHPGFNSVCLDKWSLRLTATKLRTRKKEQYRQTSTEDKFYRSTAYRSFVWLVFGHLGNRRYPLPACAYERIRRHFPPTDNEDFVGFVEEEDSS